MLSILIAFAAALLVGASLHLTHLLHSVAATIAPALLTFVGVGYLSLQRGSKSLEPLVAEATKHVQGGRLEMAIKLLESGMVLGRWNPLVPAQLRTLIGSLLFDSGKPKEAEPYLERAMRWPWSAKAQLAVCRFKRHDEKGMIKAFEVAVSVGEKEGLAWTLYAWCLQARGKKDETVAVLERGLKKLPGDARLVANLELAKEGKKLKTAPYGDKWSRFQLEQVGPVVPKMARGFALRPGFRQRPQRKK